MQSKFAGLFRLRVRLLLAGILLGLLTLPVSAHAQTQAVLGNATVDLTGPWKFHTGDNMAWAQPGFDDSGWQDYTIDPKHPALTAMQALQSEALPGWQQHGHPGYTGYAWYRIRLQTPSDVHALALLMPGHVDDAYEVFVNGTKIGSLGKLDGWHIIYPPQPKVFSIPAAALNSGRPATLAIRVWNQRYDGAPSEHNLDGGLRGVPLLGSSALLHVFQQSQGEQRRKTSLRDWLLIALYGSVGVISLFLFLLSRRQREYLWAGISLIAFATLSATILTAQAQQTTIPLQLGIAAAYVAAAAAVFAMPFAAMYLLGVPRTLWRRANYVVFALDVAAGLVVLGLVFGLLPPTAAWDRVSHVAFRPYDFALALLLLAIAVDGLRTIGRKAWLPLAPGLLLAIYVNLFQWFASAGRFVPLTDFVDASIPLAVLIVFLLRFTEQQREHVRLVDDMRQAQEVQQVLIPEELPQVPGLTIESEYRPAREVGGDFFQIIAGQDGGILAVVGDVSGKGLKAAMLVSMIVGTVRTLAETTREPMAILEGLNRSLCGRVKNQFATCVVLHIAANGETTIANAGHLAPYLNGEEVAIAGSLPLGIVETAEFSLMRFHLKENDRLILMTDGIVEAQNEKKELFGFMRTNELMRQDKSAVEIAATAQAFGQEDDITVVRIQRAVSPALAVV